MKQIEFCYLSRGGVRTPDASKVHNARVWDFDLLPTITIELSKLFMVCRADDVDRAPAAIHSHRHFLMLEKPVNKVWDFFPVTLLSALVY